MLFKFVPGSKALNNILLQTPVSKALGIKQGQFPFQFCGTPIKNNSKKMGVSPFCWVTFMGQLYSPTFAQVT
jgi:hypothetical protein